MRRVIASGGTCWCLFRNESFTGCSQQPCCFRGSVCARWVRLSRTWHCDSRELLRDRHLLFLGIWPINQISVVLRLVVSLKPETDRLDVLVPNRAVPENRNSADALDSR